MAFYVSVCGPSRCTEEDERNARLIGRLLAERSAQVICSGYTGVAVAVAAGVRSADGISIGILWGQDRTGASPDFSVVLPTGIAEASDVLVVRGADAVIAIGGSWGTLSEIGLAMRQGDVPVVTLDGWQLLDQQGRPLPGIHKARSAEEAVDLVFALTRPQAIASEPDNGPG
jgi:uncharacterized protein (TIGR00725 family)